jgi:hypothetical protein
MPQSTVNSTTLARLVLDDVFKDFDDSRRWLRTLLEPLASPAARRFAGIAARFDQTVARSGFREAMCQVILNLVPEVIQVGSENIPVKGPLLVVSNHPGTYDSLAIAASLPRDDLKIIASGFSILRRLPNASRHLIFTEPRGDSGSNFAVVRTAIRHLQSGGAVLIFPRGRVEPDPAVLPGAIESLRLWSPSIELFLRKVPYTKVQPTIVSGVLSPVFLHTPLMGILRGLKDPQVVAEVLQIITPMLFAQWVRIKTAISFGIPKTVEELQRSSETIYHSLVAEVARLLDAHMGRAEVGHTAKEQIAHS